jgi:hypothetical protein
MCGPKPSPHFMIGIKGNVQQAVFLGGNHGTLILKLR